MQLCTLAPSFLPTVALVQTLVLQLLLDLLQQHQVQLLMVVDR